MKNNNRKILLTFDVEEFDLPLEYGINLPLTEQMAVAKEGLDNIEPILNQKSICCTLFTTANFARTFPDEIAALSKHHEIASHTFYHSSFRREDLLCSKQVIENIISKKVSGLRMPRMKKIDSSWISEAGYIYDSSLNPTWLPGRYNNIKFPRKYYIDNELMEIPVSVSANFRIPLFWLTFKNFPYAYYKRLALGTLAKDGYLSLYFHPWEFADLNGFNIPSYIKKKSGTELLDKLNRLIIDLKNEGEFSTMSSLLL